MADATGITTTNYAFKTLDGQDTAGYTSINSVITSIDTQLQDKTFKSGMVILFYNVGSPTVSGWTTLGQAVTGLPTLSGNYWWIKKN